MYVEKEYIQVNHYFCLTEKMIHFLLVNSVGATYKVPGETAGKKIPEKTLGLYPCDKIFTVIQ